MEQTYMREKKVLPLVLSMSLPMVISMLVAALYNIIDSYFIAKISEDAMTAISLVYPIQNFVNAVAVGFGVGLNTASAYFLGAEDQEQASDAATLGVCLSIAHGLALTVLCEAFAPWFLSLFTSDAAVLDYGMEYVAIVIAFSVPITVGIAFEKLFQAEGLMVVAMASMISGCVINVIFDQLLIYGLGPFPALGIKGAALATGLGQMVPLAVYIVIYFVKHAPLRVRIRREMWSGTLCKRLYGVGIPAGLNMALPSLLITALNGMLASFSAVYVLVLGIYYKLQTFIYLTANGIVQGIRPIVGYNYGAREYGRVHEIFRTALTLIASVMGAGMVVCMLAAGPLIGLFAQNAETLTVGKAALRIISLGFVVSSLSVSVTGVLEGLGLGSLSLWISLMRNLVVIVPLAFLLCCIFGPTGVWHAFWVSEAVTGLSAWLLYRRNVQRGILSRNIGS